MDRETQKNVLYESLLDLTKESEELNRYFSPKRILGHILEMSGNDGREIPSQTLLYENLEELVDENKAEKMIGEVGSAFGRSSYNSYFYRAVSKN